MQLTWHTTTNMHINGGDTALGGNPAADASALLVLGSSTDPAFTTPTMVVGFVLFFVGLHAFSIVTSGRLAPRIYNPLTRPEQLDWHGRVVGSIFAACVSLFALPELLSPGGSLAADPDFGTSDRARLVMSAATGFFIWDVVFCVCAQQGAPYVLHAAIALFVYSHALQPFQQRWACFFICWEMSTPLLNLRTQLLACRMSHTKTFAVANVTFAVAFLLVRWVFGIPLSIAWWMDCLRVLREADPRLKPYVVYVTVTGNMLLNCLNLIWGAKIVGGVLKLLRGEVRGGAEGDQVRMMRRIVSVCVMCGSPVWPSPPVVGPLWGSFPLCGSPVGGVPLLSCPRSTWHLLA